MSNDVERLRKLLNDLGLDAKNEFFSSIFQEFREVKLDKQSQEAIVKKIEVEYKVRVELGEGIAG